MAYKKQLIKTGKDKKYKEMQRIKCWSNGRIIKNPKVGWDAEGIWEELRSYKQKDGSVRIFRLEEHIDRLFRSAKMNSVEIPMTRNAILKGCKSVREANVKEDLDLKIIVENENVHILSRFALELNKLCSVKISRRERGYPMYWGQCSDGMVYLVNKKFREIEKGDLYDEILLVDSRQHVYSSFTSNLFMVVGDVIITPPNDGSPLLGITRRTVIEILQNAGLMFSKYKKSPIIIEKSITIPDLYTADCIFLTSTYGEIQAIKQLDSIYINSKDNFYYKVLKEEYSNMIRGRNEIKSGISNRKS